MNDTIYKCNDCEHEFTQPGDHCPLNRQRPRYCKDRDLYGGRGECSCDPCCPECGSDDFDEIEESEVAA
jgi:hypothetical protein